jgi:hypothetical protein
VPNQNFSRLLTYSTSEPIPWQAPTTAVDIYKNRIAMIQMFEQLKLKREAELRQQKADDEMVRQHAIQNAMAQAHLNLSTRGADLAEKTAADAAANREAALGERAKYHADSLATRLGGRGRKAEKAWKPIDPVDVANAMRKEDPSWTDRPPEEFAKAVAERVQFMNGLRGGAPPARTSPPGPMPGPLGEAGRAQARAMAGQASPSTPGAPAAPGGVQAVIQEAAQQGATHQMLPDGGVRIQAPDGAVAVFDQNGRLVQQIPPQPQQTPRSAGWTPGALQDMALRRFVPHR